MDKKKKSNSLVYEVRETSYFCTSTFQLFSILSLAYSQKENADLYIDPQFKNAEIYADRIRKLNIFREIHVIEHDKIYENHFTVRQGFRNHLQIARSYYYVDEIAEEILGKKVFYKNIYISSKAYLPRIVVLFHAKYLKNIFKVFYFDDGVGSYYRNSVIQPSKLDIIARKILVGNSANKYNTHSLLFKPDIYSTINPKSGITPQTIKGLWNYPEGMHILDTVFDMENVKKISKDVIIIEEPYTDIFTDENAQLLQTVYESIIKAFGAQNITIKKHPRSEKEENADIDYYKDFSVPFEVLCMDPNLEKKIIVSYGSTAAITPKILFDKEPYVIMLFKIVNAKTIPYKVLYNVFSAIKDTYKGKNRFFMPESLDELTSIIGAIKKEKDQ